MQLLTSNQYLAKFAVPHQAQHSVKRVPEVSF